MNLRKNIFILFTMFILLFGSLEDLYPATELTPDLFGKMSWRCIGPSRGGRVTAVTGVSNQPLVYYFGSTGGGVWKTENAGITWRNISDDFFKKGSVGAIAVAESDSRVIYVGMGESSLRNDISHGDGVYRSLDGGRTWKHRGLRGRNQRNA